MSGEAMQRVCGLGVSPGIAIGRAVCLASAQGEVYRFPLAAEDVPAEKDRLRQAVAAASEELRRIRAQAEEELGDELAAIFEAHSVMLEDPFFQEQVEQRIAGEKVNAEWAVHETAAEIQQHFESLDAPEFRERGNDLRDVARHLLRALGGIAHHELSEIQGDVVIVADDLTPSEAIRLGRERVVAFAIEGGGRTSHTTIIARSLKIPLVAGLAKVTTLVTDEDPVVIDGTEGEMILHPSPEVLADYVERQERQAAEESLLEPIRDLRSVTRDGVTVDLLANVDLLEEIDDAVRVGAQGIGLYRSEFLYIETSPELPSEDEHVRTYRELIERMSPHPVTIRTYDLGGRKIAREVLDTREDNPVLGLRGVRLILSKREIFRTQLRALFRAACDAELRIMLPLVSGVGEVREFRAFAAEVLADLHEAGVRYCENYRLGAMIEVPSAALIAPQLAREVDFFSIGTNDLIQYSMAVDRNNEQVSHLYEPLHPAILHMIRFAADSARAAGIEVSICGEMAADPRYTPLLLGLGMRTLSVSPRALPEVKRTIRSLAVSDWSGLSDRLLRCATGQEVEEILEEQLTATAAPSS